MKVGLLAGRYTVGDYATLLDCALMAESAGFDSFYRSDHHLSLDGDYERPVTEAWTSVSGLARDTSVVGLGILVSPTHFRHPTLLARMAATVALMSGGRLAVGLGAGGFTPDRELMGFPALSLTERYAYLREYITCLQGLWSSESFTFHGDSFDYDGARLEPRPGAATPTLIVGGKGTPGMIQLVAELDVELNLDFPTLSKCGEVAEQLRAAIATYRSPSAQLPLSVEVHPPVDLDAAETLSILRGFHEIGVREVVFFMPPSGAPARTIAALGEILGRWRAGTA